jgi:hypothetical protein
VQRNINLLMRDGPGRSGACFAMLPLLACGAGVYLGLYFNILVLLPLSMLGVAAFVLSSWASGQSYGVAALLVPLICSQAGYMLGLTARETYGHLLARLNIGQSRRI